MNEIFVQFAAFENEILAIQARKEQIVMETDDDARDKDVPAEKDRIGLTEVRMTFGAVCTVLTCPVACALQSAFKLACGL